MEIPHATILKYSSFIIVTWLKSERAKVITRDILEIISPNPLYLGLSSSFFFLTIILVDFRQYLASNYTDKTAGLQYMCYTTE